MMDRHWIPNENTGILHMGVCGRGWFISHVLSSAISTFNALYSMIWTVSSEGVRMCKGSRLSYNKYL